MSCGALAPLFEAFNLSIIIFSQTRSEKLHLDEHTSIAAIYQERPYGAE